MSAFFDALFVRHATWRALPLVERSGSGWKGTALIVPPPPGSDLSGGLDIEEVDREITIGLDHSHIHMRWPPMSVDPVKEVWADPITLTEAILSEKVLSASGWIDGQLRVGSLREVDKAMDLIVPNLERLRIRSWRGTFDRDEMLQTR